MRKPRVLLVDDDDRLRYLLIRTLGHERFDLLEAPDGAQALQLAVADKPDLVVLDIGLPGMDGLEVCRLLKGSPSTADIKVLILTAHPEEEDGTAAKRFRADAYMTKPFHPREFLETAYALIEQGHG